MSETFRSSARPSTEGLGVLPRGVLPLAAVPGIGAEDAARLGRLGLHTTSDFAFADLPALARASGIGEAHLQRWREAAELLALEGMDAAFAAQLLDAGLGSVRILARLSPADVERFLTRHLRRSGADDDGLARRGDLGPRCAALVQAARRAEGI